MKKIRAFTLAETLITLMVIGVVAALTIPALMQQIGDYTLEKQRTVFEKKFAEGLRQMRVDEKLAEKYATTADFVNEMQKYFKIANVCNKDNLTGCFPTESFTYHDDMTDLTFTTSDLKTTGDIAAVTGHDLGYETDVMGVVLSDGAQILIAVNPDCEGVSGGDTNGNHTSCFKYIADVNGKKSPSAVGKDIMSNINMSALDFEIASVGAVGSDTYGSVNGDYWLGAQAYCESLTENGGGWRLPTETECSDLNRALYPSNLCHFEDDGTGIEIPICDLKVYDSELYKSLGLGDEWTAVWTNTINDGTEDIVSCNFGEFEIYSGAQSRDCYSCKVLCVK